MIYFDNAATTKISEKVLEAMIQFEKESYANVDSIHSFGIDTLKQINEKKKILQKIFGVDERLFHFTAGGAEANSIAVSSVLNAYKDGHVITTEFEHASLKNVVETYTNYEITYINPKLDNMSADKIIESIRPDTVLITLTSCNSEIGNIYDISNIAKKIKAKYPNIIIHTDFVQALGHTKIDLTHIDMLSISSHKIHGPKGIGAIYVKKDLKLKFNYYGDNKNNGITKRTMPNGLVYGFLVALEELEKTNMRDILLVKEYAINQLKDTFNDNCYVIENNHDSILAFSLKNVLSEVLFNYLSSKQIYISIGSACSTGESKVIRLLELDKSFSKGMVRVSFSKYSTKEEVDEFIKELKVVYRMFNKN